MLVGIRKLYEKDSNSQPITVYQISTISSDHEGESKKTETSYIPACSNVAASSTPNCIGQKGLVNVHCQFCEHIFNNVRITAILLNHFACNPVKKYCKKWKIKRNYSVNNGTSLNLVSMKENLVR